MLVVVTFHSGPKRNPREVVSQIVLMRWTIWQQRSPTKVRVNALIAAMIIKYKLTNLEQFNPQTKTNLRFVRQQVMECGGTAEVDSAKSATIVRELQGMG